jgi:hypothetical protein
VPTSWLDADETCIHQLFYRFIDLGFSEACIAGQSYAAGNR